MQDFFAATTWADILQPFWADRENSTSRAVVQSCVENWAQCGPSLNHQSVLPMGEVPPLHLRDERSSEQMRLPRGRGGQTFIAPSGSTSKPVRTRARQACGEQKRKGNAADKIWGEGSAAGDAVEHFT